ncbi:MAG TPA: GNAT family N-acetyltransferase [Thermoplasmata archaeon]|nr:GNAT family N-acetyltransferase [Thermoplasmata archaeon]
MIRELLPGDTGQVFRFLKGEFPEEERLLGTRPEGFEQIVRRLFRWDSRLLLGLLRAVGRPLFRFFVVAKDGTIVGTTLLTYPEGTGYVSMVVVDPAERRQGHARHLLEAARAATARRGRPFIALDVLEGNAPARRLYESLGYRTLRATGYFVRETPAPGGAAAAGSSSARDRRVRPFRRSDARPLAEIAQRSAPAEVQRVLPIRARELVGSNWVSQMLGMTSSAWVIDRGNGPEAHLSASSSPATEAGHLSMPIVAETADPAAVSALVGTAVDWLTGRGVPRIVAMVPEANARGRAALEAAGFRHAIGILTLYRPSG